MKTRITLIDGNSFLFRAFYGVKILNRHDGTPINAVYGLCTMLINLLSKSLPNEKFYMVFDANKKNFRHEIYPKYKANRPPLPPELIPQFPLSRLAVNAFNIPVLEIEGYEADDILATMANSCFLDKDIRIVTSDKDLMQLISSCCYLYDSMKNKEIHESDCIEKFGVSPDKVIYVQALMGDTADNIPGAKGIGPKTAAELINTYGNIENLYNNIDKIKPESKKQKLIDSKDDVFLSLKLAKLKTDVPLPELKEQTEIDINKLTNFFINEMNSNHLVELAKKTFKKTTEKETEPTYKIINNTTDLTTLINTIKKQKQFSFKIISNENNFMSDNLIGISISVDTDNAFYIPFKTTTNLLNTLNSELLDINYFKTHIYPLFLDENITKIGYNLKQDFHIIANENFDTYQIKNYHDIALISYLLNGTTINNDLDSLTNNYLNKQTISLDNNKKNNLNIENLDIQNILNYCAEKSHHILQIFNTIYPILQNQDKLLNLYITCDLPLIFPLLKMERNGVLIDYSALNNLSQNLHSELSDLEKNIYNISGEIFNIASPTQLGNILFNKLGIEYKGKKTKAGHYQTDIKILEEISDSHEIIPLIIKWRTLTKLTSTYTDALPNFTNKKTGRIHSSYLQTSTNTGRLSSRDPNMQNIPIRSEYGEQIRNMFIAAPNNKLIIADYSQIQLRLLAHIANLETMKTVFNINKDIHLMTASQIFNKPENEITPSERRIAKTTNFSIIYGVSSFGLAEQLGIDRPSAQKIIDKYFEIYPGIKTYMQEIKDYVLSHGYVLTPWGRKIDLPEVMNSATKQYALRAAINAPIQGFEADIMRLATATIFKLLKEKYPSAKIIMQIHDELVFEVPNEISEKCAKLIKDTMEHITSLSVPLISNTVISNRWDK